MSVMLSSLLRIETLLKCSICLATLRQARVLSGCGHRFCNDCITAQVEGLGECPTCQVPATMDNVKEDTMHDNLVSYVNKLKTALLKHSLTPIEESLRRREELHEENRKRPMADMTSSTQESEDLEAEYRDDPKRFKSSSSDFIDELLSDRRPVRNRNAPPPSYVVDMDLDEDPAEMSIGATTPSIVGAPVPEQPALLIPVDDLKMKERKQEESNDEEEEEGEEEEVQIKSAPPPRKAAAAAATKARTPEPTETSDKTWDCPECHFENKSYMQICGICKKSRNRKVRPPIATRTRASRNSEQQQHKQQQETLGATILEPSLEGATVPATAASTTTKSSRRRQQQQAVEEAASREVHVIRTSLTEEDSQMMEKMSEKIADTTLKVTIHTEIKHFSDITHVISSVNKKRQCHRTLKYLHGLLLGKWIVSPQWYMDSIKAKQWLREEDYEIQGDAKSGSTHAPRQGRLTKKRLFQDMNFYLVGDFPEKHSKKDIGILIQAGGGNAYNRKPAKSLGFHDKKVNTIDPSQPIVLCCPVTKKKNLELLKQFQVREPVWIVDCISKLKIE